LSRPAGTSTAGLPLDPELLNDIEPRLIRLRRPLGERALADCTFCNLRLFREAHQYRYLPGALPCVAGRAYDGTATLMPLFGLSAVPASELQTLQGEHAWFYPVPEEALALLDPARTQARALREDADYLYAAAPFADFSAPGLAAKRSAVARLRARGRVDVSPLDAATRVEALTVLEGWREDKGLGADAADVQPCREALEELAPGAVLRGFLHAVGGIPAGFVIVEELNPGVLVVRFAKGRAEFDGIFPLMFQDLVVRLGSGVKWLNFEQDLGRPNFRRTKQSFHPVALLAKYRVRVRSA
jgi:uncharacterized protein